MHVPVVPSDAHAKKTFFAEELRLTECLSQTLSDPLFWHQICKTEVG